MAQSVGSDFAHPHPYKEAPGLTKREWFAGMALQGVLASSSAIEGDAAARHALVAADELIALLEKDIEASS